MSASAIRAAVEAAFGAAPRPLAAWYAELLATTPPLLPFAAANAAKIRKKARAARTPDEQRDLRCELAVAAALANRHSPLTYEPLAAAGGRGPDFLLRHKGHTDVYVEVSRLRPANGPAPDPANRLGALLCGKLGQLAPGGANLLTVISDADPYPAAAMAALIQNLCRRADAKDDAFFAFRGLAGARAFLQALPRLSALLLVAPAHASHALWLHPHPRHPLPADLARAAATWPLAASLGPLDN